MGQPWYEVYEKGSSGNKATLLYTDEQQAYTIIDRATFITCRDSLKDLVALYEGEATGLNSDAFLDAIAETLAGM